MDTGALKLFNIKECLEIVRNSLKLPNDEKIVIERYNVDNCSTDLVGFMGEYLKLNIHLDDKTAKRLHHNNRLQYFVKSVPIANERHRDECERKGFFPKEICIYTKILPNIQKYSSTKLFPACYYAREDLLVLEDFSAPSQGLRHLEIDEPYTAHHHKLVLQHLSQLHAASIAWELNENLNIGERFVDHLFELQLTTSNEWYLTGAKGIIYLAKMHPKYQDDESQRFINDKLLNILCHVEKLTTPSKSLRNVLCHRDTWDRNIFYSFGSEGRPVECRIVDFQATRYCPPAIDVLFFIYVTTTKEERDRRYDEYVAYYYAALGESLKKCNLPPDTITKTDFAEDCRHARLVVLILMAIGNPLLKMPTGLSTKMRAEEQEKFDFYMNTNREELFERIMKIDSGYRDVIMASVEELLDYLLQYKCIYSSLLNSQE